MKSLLRLLGILVCVLATGHAQTLRTSTQKINTFTVPAGGGSIQIEAQTDWHLDDYATPLPSTYDLYVAGGSQVGRLTLTIDGGTDVNTGHAVLLAHDKPSPVGMAFTLARWTVNLAAGNYEVRHTTRDFQQANYAGGYVAIITNILSITTPPPVNPATGGIGADQTSLPGQFGGSALLSWTANYCTSATVTYSYTGPAGAKFTGWNSLPLNTNPSSPNSGTLSVTLPINTSTTDLAKHTFTISGQNAQGEMTAEAGKDLTVTITVREHPKKPQPILTLLPTSPQHYDEQASQVLNVGGGAGTGSYWVTLVSQNPAGIATLSGNVLTATKASTGTVVVRGYRNGDNEYEDATPIERTIELAIKGTVNPDPDPTGTLSTNTTELNSAGGSVTVSWTQGGSPTSATLSGQGFTGSESVLGSPVGSRVVTLPANTSDTTDATYTWTLSVAKDSSHAGHTSSAHPTVTTTRTVIVRKRTAEPQASLSVNGASVATVQLAGSPATCSATVSWSSSNVQDEAGTFTVTGYGLNSTGVLSGSQVVAFTTAGSYTYTLSGVGLNGTPITRTATVTVQAAAPPPPPTQGVLSLTATPATLPAAGGTVTLTWSNDGTWTEIAGTAYPVDGVTPNDFAPVSTVGSMTVTLPGNPTTTAKIYYFQARGNGSNAGPVRASVVVSGQAAAGALQTTIDYLDGTTSYLYQVGEYRPNVGAVVFHTSYANRPPGGAPYGTWTFPAGQTSATVTMATNSIGIVSGGDYELVGITVSPAAALTSWSSPLIDPASPTYNPKAFGETVTTEQYSATSVCQINFSNGPVQVKAILKKRPMKTIIARSVIDKGVYGLEKDTIYRNNPCAYGSSTTSITLPNPYDDGTIPTYYSTPPFKYVLLRVEETDSNGTRVIPSPIKGTTYTQNLSTLAPGQTRTYTYYFQKQVSVFRESPPTQVSYYLGSEGHDEWYPVGSQQTLYMWTYDVPHYSTDEWGYEYEDGVDYGSDWEFVSWMVDGTDRVVPQTNPSTYTIPDRTSAVGVRVRSIYDLKTLFVGMFVYPSTVDTADNFWVSPAWLPTLTVNGVGSAWENADYLPDRNAIIMDRSSTAGKNVVVAVRFPPREGKIIASSTDVVFDQLVGSASGSTWEPSTRTFTFTVPSGSGKFHVSAHYRTAVDFTITNVEQTYDGMVKKATVVPSNASCVEGVDYEVVYDGQAAVKDVKRQGSATGAVTDYRIQIRMKGVKYGLGKINGSTLFRIMPRPLDFVWGGDLSTTWANLARSVSATPSGFVNGDSNAFGVSWTYDGAPYVRSATDAGNYLARAIGQGNYTGNSVCSWTIQPTPVSFTFSPTQFTFNGVSQGPTVTPSIGGATWRLDDVNTSTSTNAGYYSFRAIGTGNYTGTSVCNWAIAPAPLTFTITGTKHTYDGTPKQVTVEARDAGAMPVAATAYTVIYTPRAPNTDQIHRAVGFYDVFVTAMGNYTGSAVATMEIESGATTQVTALTPVPHAITITDPQHPAYGRTYQRSWNQGGVWHAYLGRPGVRFHVSATGAAPIDRCELEARWGADSWAPLAAATIDAPGIALERDFEVCLGGSVAEQPLIPLSFQQGNPHTGPWHFRARVRDTTGSWSAWSADVPVQVVLPLASASETLRTVPPAGGMGEWFTASNPKTFTVPMWIP